MHFRNSFCYRLIEVSDIQFRVVSVPWRTNLIISSPLGLLRFQELVSFLFIMKLSYSKPLYSTLNYASAVNIQEVMKFYNLGNKSFETDFNLHVRFIFDNFHFRTHFLKVYRFELQRLIILKVYKNWHK